jgi:small subunit ribosomal protein S20
VPNIRSAKKQLRQNRQARVRNREQRAELRTALKRVRAAASPADAAKAYQAAEVLLDRAARKGLIHGNAAARQKSRLARLTKPK